MDEAPKTRRITCQACKQNSELPGVGKVKSYPAAELGIDILPKDIGREEDQNEMPCTINDVRLCDSCELKLRAMHRNWTRLQKKMRAQGTEMKNRVSFKFTRDYTKVSQANHRPQIGNVRVVLHDSRGTGEWPVRSFWHSQPKPWNKRWRRNPRHSDRAIVTNFGE